MQLSSVAGREYKGVAMKTFNAVLGAVAIVALTACQSAPPTASLDSEPQVTLPKWENASYRYVPVNEPASLFALSQEQQQEFLSYYYAPENQDVSPNFRLSDYLNKLVEHFSYVGETFTASETLNNQSGNCLSLAVLTTALARLVGLDVYYQQVHTPPIYRRINGILTTSTHVRSVVLEPLPEKKDDVIFFRSRAVIDYFPSASNDIGDYLTEESFISMYYQNMAAEAMGKNESDLAYSLLAEAMQLEPTNAETLNTLAVLYRMDNHLTASRTLYEYAIDIDNKSIHTLSNFAVLLNKVNDTETLKKIGDMYLEADDSNPYRWYDIGNRMLAKGNYERAELFFKRAIDKGPYLSEGYSGLARLYYLKGDLDRAVSTMEKAMSLSFPSDNRELYAAKLEALQRSIKQ
jgi:tetratricopeptide (TPR) repeat protein